MRQLLSYLSALIGYEDSALRSALTGGEEWTVERELLASSLDALNVLAHDYRRKGKPVVIPRPGEASAQRASSPAEVAAFFGAG